VPLAWAGPVDTLEDPWSIPSCDLSVYYLDEEEYSEGSCPAVGEDYDFCAALANLIRAGQSDRLLEMGLSLSSLPPDCDLQDLLSLALTAGSMDFARWLVDRGATYDASELELFLEDF